MSKLHDILTDYLRMANGLFPVSFRYTDEVLRDDVLGEPGVIYPAWDDFERDLQRILEARGMTRRQFMSKGAVPVPSFIANLVYSSELRKIYGDLTGIEGFDAKGNYVLPKRAHGLLYPVKDGKEITRLEFLRFSTLFKPKSTSGKTTNKAPVPRRRGETHTRILT